MTELEWQKPGDAELPDLDLWYLCFSPSEAGPLVLPLAAVKKV